MKKFSTILLAIILLTCLLAGCNSRTTDDIVTTAESIAEVSEVSSGSTNSFSKEALTKSYIEGNWDGSFISNDEHCASIENGILWLDCQETDVIPDMGQHGQDDEDQPFWSRVISSSELGTWVQSTHEMAKLSFWSKGKKEKEYNLPKDWDAYSTTSYKSSEDLFVSRYGQHLQVINIKKGQVIYKADNIIDVYQESLPEVWFSDFEHNNYTITPEGEIEQMDYHFVWFPREQAKLIEIHDVIELTYRKAVNEYFLNGWNGDFRQMDDHFIYIDYFGTLVLDNQEIGSIHSLGEIRFVDAPNTYFSKERALLFNGEKLLIFKEDDQTEIEVPDGPVEILWEDQNNIVAHVYGGKLFIVRGEKVEVIANSADDAIVAYDTLYYLRGSSVYSLDWENTDAKPEIFFEGAYGLSPLTDEAEGALVPEKRANYKGYGFESIYSPYGN